MNTSDAMPTGETGEMRKAVPSLFWQNAAMTLTLLRYHLHFWTDLRTDFLAQKTPEILQAKL
jgi:hypothetical protein